MGLKDLTLQENSLQIVDYTTALGVETQSSAAQLTLSSISVNGGIQLQFEDDTEAANRRTVTFRNKPSVYDPKTKTWSKQKRTVSISGPVYQENSGTYQANAIRIELDVTATANAGDITKLLNFAGCALTSSDTRKFFTVGSPE